MTRMRDNAGCRLPSMKTVIVLVLAATLAACGHDHALDPGSGGGAGSGSGTGSPDGGAPAQPCSDAVASDPDVQQMLPATLDTTFPSTPGQTLHVAAGGDLQAALDSAQPGDQITIDAGATFTGPFTLPSKSGDGWIVVRSADPELPAAGTRVTPADAAHMPKILAPNSESAFVTAAGAHHFRLVGLEIAPVDANAMVYVLVQLGDGATTQLSDVPHDLVLDRLYVHGTPTGYLKRGIGIDSARTAVIDSYVSDCHAVGQDAQAIACFNGPGPFKIVDNYLEGSGENVIFGGADPKIPNLVPADIEIRRNYFSKPLTWKTDDPSYAGTHWSVKNLLELKNAERVLVQCNVFEHNWADAQVGLSILMTPRNQDGSAPWCAVSDVTVVDNVVRDVASGFNLAGEDDLHPSQETQRIVVANNLVYGLDPAKWGGDGRSFQVTTPGRPILGLKIAHNTVFTVGNATVSAGDTMPVAQDFVFRDDLVSHGSYGVFGSGKGEGTAALDFYFPGWKFDHDVGIGFPAQSYPTGNAFPATPADVGFVDYAGGDYRLGAASLYKGTASDGTDPGADIDRLLSGIAGVAP